MVLQAKACTFSGSPQGCHGSFILASSKVSIGMCRAEAELASSTGSLGGPTGIWAKSCKARSSHKYYAGGWRADT